MERFTVKIVDDSTNKEFIHKFEEMKYAKPFAKRISKITANKNCFIEVIDNKVNQVVYYLYQVDGKVINSNL